MLTVRFWRALTAAAWLGACLPSQDFIELPWRTNEEGLLEVQAAVPVTNGEDGPRDHNWYRMFPQLLGDPKAGLGAPSYLGPIAALPLILHGHGGAADIAEGGHRLRKLGIRVAANRASMHAVQPDPLLDLLRVRQVAAIDVGSALSVLGDYAKDDRRSVFVRAAAAHFLQRNAEYLTFAPFRNWQAALTTRNGPAALHAGLARMPDDVHIVLGVHCARLPTTAPLLRAWRRFRLAYASAISMQQGGALSPARLAIMQWPCDTPGQLPYELAVRLGNWRVDYALLAVRCGPRPECWLHLGGVFQPDLIAEGLRSAGCAVRLNDQSELHAEGYGWKLRVTETAFEAWPNAMTIGARGARLADWHGWANADQPAVAALVLPTTALAHTEHLTDDGLLVQFDPEAKTVTAEATCKNARGAKALRSAFAAYQQKRRCDPDGTVPGPAPITWGDVSAAKHKYAFGGPPRSLLAWRRCVQATVVSVEKETVHWQCDLSPFPLTDLVRLLGTPPGEVLENW